MAAIPSNGAVSLLVWNALQLARQMNRGFDFDGFGTHGAANFVREFEAHDFAIKVLLLRTLANRLRHPAQSSVAALSASCRRPLRQKRWNGPRCRLLVASSLRSVAFGQKSVVWLILSKKWPTLSTINPWSSGLV